VTFGLLLLILLSESCMVAGQIFFKHAMGEEGQAVGEVARSNRKIQFLLLGLVSMTAGFFLWMQLLNHFKLSYLYPFEGLDRILLIAPAMFFLKEKMTLRLWIGMIVIVVGVVLVGLS
jgi:undecaprenyl phosphate-alpha-L-ara4N flippase subunit ArnE